MPERHAPLIGVPIKPFGIAKQRLESRVDPAARSRLGRNIAAHTLRTIAAAGGDPIVISGNAGVRAWATGIGFPSEAEGPPGTGLNGAVGALQARARREDRPWLAVHADLPLIDPGDVAVLIEQLGSATAVISPSYDGGTSALGAATAISLQYGVGSYHRHLRAMQRLPRVATICRPGLAFDLDTVADFDMLVSMNRSSWIRDHLEAIDSVR